MRWTGLEPASLAAPPPQDGVSANFTTSARCDVSVAAAKYTAVDVGLAMRGRRSVGAFVGGRRMGRAECLAVLFQHGELSRAKP